MMHLLFNAFSLLTSHCILCSGVFSLRVDDETGAHNDHGTVEFSFMKTRLTTWEEGFKNDPKLFKGCKKVFLDVGANRGTHIRKLYEPEKYPDAPYLAIFDNAFGKAAERSKPSNETGICAFGFEANPRWTPDLKAIQTAYAKKGWRAHFFVPTAVSDSNGTMNLTMKKSDAGKSDWGATVIQDSEPEKKDANTVQVAVPAQDLSSFLQTMDKNVEAGYKLMKMDIEGSEYVVLPSLLKDGLLCRPQLDQVTIEWHYLPGKLEAAFCQVATAFWPLQSFFMSLKEHHMGTTCTQPDVAKIALSVKADVEDKEKCKPKEATLITDIDDESYLQDGMPLP